MSRMSVIAVVLTVLVLLMLLSIYMTTNSMSTTLTNYAQTNTGQSVKNLLTFTSVGTKTFTVKIPTNACAKRVLYSFFPKTNATKFKFDIGTTEEGTEWGQRTETTPANSLASGAKGHIDAPSLTVANSATSCNMGTGNVLYFTVTVSANGETETSVPVTFLFETEFSSYNDFISNT